MPVSAALRALSSIFVLGVCACDAPVFRSVWTWVESQAEPGPLDPAHQRLGLACDDCHTPIRGVGADACIACHALNESLVQEQTMAFHADARACADCHVEHTGATGLRAPLDHDLLAVLAPGWVQGGTLLGESADAPRDATSLDCAVCHSNQDPHFDLFGSDCAECHDVTTWDVSGFTHPTLRSRDCAQCHQAPPSHYMKHFKMLSAKVAGQPHADVRECYSCHLTTSWPDIQGIGFYKHH